ncbi:MAG: CvpA family protein [Gammaproteobacteria bacterium]|nr:MAG: CvpA family protein [Gammaproteobacteria bacterium]
MPILDWIDYLILGLLVAFSVIGLFRGFAAELVALIAWVAAILVAKGLAPTVYWQLGRWFDNEMARWALAWSIPFFAVMLAAALLKYLLTQLMEATGLGGVNRVLGALIGGAKAVLAVTITVLLLRLTIAPAPKPLNDRSVLLPYFDKFAARLVNPVQIYLGPRLEMLQTRLSSTEEQNGHSVDLKEPVAILKDLGFSSEAIDYLRQNPEVLRTTLDEALKHKPEVARKWNEWLAQNAHDKPRG